jgi:hypothetical protein
MIRKLFLGAALLLLGACDQQLEATRHAVAACRAPLKPAVQVDLYFGRDKGVKGEVTESEWSNFLAEEVTAKFPDGLTVVDINGQFRDPASGRIVRERGKLLIVVVFDAPNHNARVEQVVKLYNTRFGQHSVFRTERPVCAGA